MGHKARATARELAEFSRMLTTAVERGIPLERAMEVIASQARTRRFRRALDQVSQALKEGDSLPDALRRSPAAFPPEYPPLVDAGIKANHLPEVLRRLETYHSLRARLSRGFARVLAYIGTGLFASLIFLTTVILLIRNMPLTDATFWGYWWREPPLGSRIIHWVATHVTASATILISGIVLLLAGLILLKLVLTRTRLGYLLPAWGPLQKSRDLGIFCTTVALLLDTGTPAEECLGSAARAVPHRYARKQVREVQAKVAEGDTVSSALFYSRFFPRTLSWAISVGESRGDVPGALHLYAELYAAELERNFEVLHMLLTPLAVLLLGNVVVVLVLGMMEPLLSFMTIPLKVMNR